MSTKPSPIASRRFDRRAWFPILVFGAPLVFIVAFMLFPYSRLFLFSLFRAENYTIVRDINIDNYVKVFSSHLYQSVVLQTVKVAVITTVCTIPLAYFMAYYIVFVSRIRREVLYFLVVVPLWTSFLLKVYVWKLILGRTGLINNVLMYSDLIDAPLDILLYNQFSVYITLVYTLFPFAFLPIYTSLEKIKSSYIEASLDLGAGPLLTVRRIILPLSMPGVLAGAVFTFCLSFGDFITPSLVGGPRSVMISNIIVSQFGVAFDWPLGSALAIVVLGGVLAVISFASLAERGRFRAVS